MYIWGFWKRVGVNCCVALHAVHGAGAGSADAACDCSFLHGAGSWVGGAGQRICAAQWYAFLVTNLSMFIAVLFTTWSDFLLFHAAALSLMGLNFIKGFGFLGLPIFISLAACNEVCPSLQ